jgi:hypothetical protein
MHPCNIDKKKFSEYKKSTEAQMVDMGISVEDRRCYLKVTPKFTHGQRKVSFNDAAKVERMKFYKQTHH